MLVCPSLVEHTEGLKKELEKNYNTVMEEGAKYLSSKKSEVESKRSEIETREKNVENVLSKVSLIKWNRKTPLKSINTLKYIHN